MRIGQFEDTSLSITLNPINLNLITLSIHRQKMKYHECRTCHWKMTIAFKFTLSCFSLWFCCLFHWKQYGFAFSTLVHPARSCLKGAGCTHVAKANFQWNRQLALVAFTREISNRILIFFAELTNLVKIEKRFYIFFWACTCQSSKQKAFLYKLFSRAIWRYIFYNE